jgi:hypothetical protein
MSDLRVTVTFPGNVRAPLTLKKNGSMIEVRQAPDAAPIVVTRSWDDAVDLANTWLRNHQ